MRRFVHSTDRHGPTVFETVRLGVRERASYLSSRWVQAPIVDRREADT